MLPREPAAEARSGGRFATAVERVAGATVTGIAVAASIYHLYAAYWHPFFALKHRAIHWLLMAGILFILYPLMPRRGAAPAAGWRLAGRVAYSLLFLGASLAAGLYVLVNYEAIAARAGAYTTTDVAFGILAVIVVMEGARQGTGWAVPAVATLFLLYAFAGPYLPPLLGHRGYSLDRVVPYLYLTTDGIYGVPLGVSAQFILLFIVYGAILEKTGAGQFFLKLAMALAGSARGGPAKAAVLASAMMGTVSGSSVANTVTTGTFTIPLMKRMGFSAEEAGGVEASASTMGQVMPPVMGAAAFLLAEYIGVPYLKVAVAAAIPALLALLSMFVQVDLAAARRGLLGLPRSELPRLGPVLREGWHYLVPLSALFYLLLAGYSPERAVFWTILLTLAVALVHGALKGRTREVVRQLLQAFRDGGINTVEVAAACAAAGIIIGVTTMTGLGLRISGIVVDLSGGSLWLAAVLAMVASIILGAGVPTTATYVILASLVAPAFVRMGVEILPAHLFIFYFGALADITPPVALAAYAASGVAGSNPFRTGIQAFRIGVAKYAIPYLFLAAPYLLLQGTWVQVAAYTAAAALGVLALSAASQKHLLAETTAFERMVLLAAAILLFIPDGRAWALGTAALALVALAQRRRRPAFPRVLQSSGTGGASHRIASTD